MTAATTQGGGFLEVDARRLEFHVIGERRAGSPMLVFLHEGLGCAALWRDFPGRLSARTGLAALVYSRYGYGRSTPFDAALEPGFMHDEALVSLPRVLDALAVERAVLVGHSDGASIALIHAAAHPRRVEAVIALAPHLFVEPLTIESIAAVAKRFDRSDMPRRMARYHLDPQATFRRWSAIWLDPRFREWSIEPEVAKLSRPTLALQGFDDEYGTILQVRRVAELCPLARWIGIEQCGHSPFVDQPDRVLDEVARFVAQLGIARRHGDAPVEPNADPASPRESGQH